MSKTRAPCRRPYRKELPLLAKSRYAPLKEPIRSSPRADVLLSKSRYADTLLSKSRVAPAQEPAAPDEEHATYRKELPLLAKEFGLAPPPLEPPEAELPLLAEEFWLVLPPLEPPEAVLPLPAIVGKKR